MRASGEGAEITACVLQVLSRPKSTGGGCSCLYVNEPSGFMLLTRYAYVRPDPPIQEI